ncbi:MAG: S-layer family protein [Cyanobacteria bacterium P01_F01_bin.86]
MWFHLEQMLLHTSLHSSIIGTIVLLGIGSGAGMAQVTSDGSLSTSVISPDGLNFTIEQGDQAGNNLFHSFDQFSIPTNGSAIFNNTVDIENIFSRVTGSSLSNIDGLIQTNDTANLFILNPNGILFGPNASLDIGGSFFATTADRLNFTDGNEFSTAIEAGPPLLSISVPMGLQFGNTANGITVNQSNLTVPLGESLGLVGGDIQLTGSQITATAGHLTLGSVAPGSEVGLDTNTFLMDYDNTTTFQDITLTQGAVANVSGNGGGTFQVQGRVISVLEDSLLLASNTGAIDGSTVSIRASERIEVIGNFGFPTSSIFVDVYDSGRGNHLQIETGQLWLSQSAFITTDTFGSGASGGMTINANDVLLFGNPDGNGVPTALSTTTFGPGQGGDLTITAERLIGQDWLAIAVHSRDNGDTGDLDLHVGQLALRGGTQIATSTFTEGNAGNVTVIATESVEITGSNTFSQGPFSSGIFSSAEPGSTGNAGNLSITTPRLSIVQGGKAAVNTVGAGEGGNVTIRADEIEVADPLVDFTGAVSGLVANAVEGSAGNGGSLDIETNRLRVFNGGQITASTDGAGNAGSITIRATEIDLSGQSDDELPSTITTSSSTNFAAGSIELASDQITVRDGAVISVSSTGGGDSGNLNVLTENLYLNNGTIQAEAMVGSGGNLDLRANSSLLMRQGSLISTNATGSATGGNIVLTSPTIVGIENSDITANAVLGIGGNIAITTQGVFGLEFREQLTPANDITASSESGLSGIVEINNVDLDPDSGLVDLPSNPVDASTQIVQECTASGGNEFIVTGRGGIPINPTYMTSSHPTWNDTRDLSAFVHDDDMYAAPPIPDSDAIAPVEATTWQMTTSGQVELLAVNDSTAFQSHVTCSGAAAVQPF